MRELCSPVRQPGSCGTVSPRNSESNLTVHCIEKKEYESLNALRQEWINQWKTAKDYKLISDKKVSVAGKKWTETEVTYYRNGSSHRQFTVFLENDDSYYVLALTSWGPYELSLPYYEHTEKTFRFIKS